MENDDLSKDYSRQDKKIWNHLFSAPKKHILPPKSEITIVVYYLCLNKQKLLEDHSAKQPH